jgi:hypothetical protein
VIDSDLVGDRKAVVKICNRIRKEAGLGSTSRMSRGVRGHPRACSVAMTLEGTGVIGVYYGNEYIHLIRGMKCEKLSTAESEYEALGRFVRNFDAGKYPELEIPRSEVKVKGEVIA